MTARMPSAANRVLFVCTGNTCRSPMAECLFREATKDRDDVEVSSAGVSAYDGGMASGEAHDLMKERGLSLEAFRSRQVTRDMVEGATHVFCLTARHAGTLLRAFPEMEGKVALVCDYLEINGQTGLDVPDPYGQGLPAYEMTLEVLDEAMPTLVAQLDKAS